MSTITIAFLAVAICCGVVSWIYSGVFLALVVENQRFWRVHSRSKTPYAHTYARACIIIPCKGMEHQLRENLTGFLRQDHPNYEVFFVVERETDPAAQLIRNLMEENRTVQTKLVIAGRAEGSGQKVHNLRLATQHLSAEIDVLVFADSDAKPNATWLRWLVNGIGREGLGARTGYRWMMPRKNNLPTLLVCTINNALASMLGRGNNSLVWGGSWAIHRKVFDLIGVREAWHGVLSDDLVASRAIHKANLRIEFEPQCVCSSSVKFSTRQMFEFLRRQFLIGRRHVPRYWYCAFALVAATQVGFWASLGLGIWGTIVGSSFGFWGLLSAGFLYASSVIRAVIRQTIGKRTFPEWRQYRHARKFDMLAGPITGLFTLAALVLSMFGNEIVWRGIRYMIGQGGSLLVLGRDMPKGEWPINTVEAPAPAEKPSGQPKILPFPRTAGDDPLSKSA